MNKNKRKIINNDSIDLSTKQLIDNLNSQLKKKGNHTFTSTHEIAGVITEEYHEMLHELINNNMENYKQELLDIAVACLFGVACINQNTLDF